MELLELVQNLVWNSKFVTVAVNTLTGTIAAGLVIALFYPLEYLETVQQLGCSQTFIGLVKTQYRQGGVVQFYKGSWASIIGHTVAWGFFFLCFEFTKQMGRSFIEGRLLVVVASMLAGVVYVTAYTPFSTLKTRIVREGKRSMEGLLSEMMDRHTAGEIYSGYLVSLLYVLESVLQFIVYEELKSRSVEQSGFYYLAIGFFSKHFAITLTYPYRVMQTILQSKSMDILSGFKKVLKKDGFNGFYRGYCFCLMRSLPPNAFMFMILELLRNFFYSLIS